MKTCGKNPGIRECFAFSWSARSSVRLPNVCTWHWQGTQHAHWTAKHADAGRCDASTRRDKDSRKGQLEQPTGSPARISQVFRHGQHAVELAAGYEGYVVGA